jgi:hypothetical protein
MVSVAVAVPGLAGSNTCTRFACEQLTNARVPANTTSAGSSSVAIVVLTRRPGTSTTLTESDTRFTTHSSEAFRNRTETGSTPTTTLPSGSAVPVDTSKNCTRWSAVCATASSLPSGLKSSAWTGWFSQFT